MPRKQGHRLTRPPLKDVKRFINRLKVVGKCWKYTGHTDNRGRPQISMGGKVQWAYRVAEAIFTGEVRVGMEVDHTCGHPWCCNPAHLQQMPPGSHHRRENHGVNNGTYRNGEVPF